jgi:hypothetical protein
MGDYVQGFCWRILFWFSSFPKHDPFSGEYGQWPEFGQLTATLSSGRRGSMDFGICLEGWGGLWVVELLEDVICCFSVFWCIFVFLSDAFKIKL